MMNFDPERVQRRVEAMSEGEMLTWLESAIPGMQRHLEQYQQTKNKDHLGELAIAEMTANFVITELMARKFPVVVSEEVLPVPGVPSEREQDTDTTSARKSFLKGRRGKTGTANAPREDTE